MSSTLVVPARFNGPPGSANGGYLAGLLAAGRTASAVTVTLREPPPLETPMDLATDDDRVVATFGGAVIATAEPGAFGHDPVDQVSFGTARQAETGFAGLRAHPFPTCFVCGPERPAGDGLGLRPGRVDGTGGTAASTWVPDGSLAGADEPGVVAAEFVWAALDCPGGWATDIEERPMVLGRMTAAVHARPDVGDRCVVVGRVLGAEGRKTFTASTAYDGDGRVLGRAESTWIELRRDAPG